MKKCSWPWLVLLTLVLLFVMVVPAVAFAADVDVGTVSGIEDVLDPSNVVALVGSSLFVLAVVNGLKKLYGLEGQKLMPVAMLLGVGLQVAVYYLGDSELFARVMLGLIFGGSACGLWVLRQDPQKA